MGSTLDVLKSPKGKDNISQSLRSPSRPVIQFQLSNDVSRENLVKSPNNMNALEEAKNLKFETPLDEINKEDDSIIHIDEVTDV